MNYRLGIDLGTSSIGVAAYELNDNNEIKDLIYLDSYIFGESITNDKKQTLNAGRRSARLMRRQVERKAKRLKKLSYIAKSIGVSKEKLDAIKDEDVIKLRAEAISRKITLPELMKVFSHIVKNRGYEGNLKHAEGDVGTKIKETKEMLEDKTLGQLLYEKREAAEKNAPWRKLNQDGTFITRGIIKNEFEQIWQEQIKHHKELKANYQITYKEMFSDHIGKDEISLKDAFSSAMFYQRPIKWNLETVGFCSLEEDEYRAAFAQPIFQKYRLAASISNLRVKTIGSKGDRPLTDDEIKKIYDYVCQNYGKYNSRAKIPYKLIYAEIGLKDNEKFTVDRAKGDAAKDTGLKGITTLQSFYNCDKEDFKFINEFNALSEKAQELAMEFLANITKYADIQENEEGYIDKKFDVREKGALIKNIKGATKDDNEKAKAFIKMLRKEDVFYDDKFNLEQGRSSYSVKALNNIIPKLLQGENEQNVIAELYPPKSEIQENPVLRDYEKVKTNNPVIDKVLREFKRTMDFIVKKFEGNPSEMTIELTRELKNSLAKRSYIESQNKIAQADRTKARNELKEKGIVLTGENIEKYLLWQDQGGEGAKCPYCGQQISIGDFVNKTQVDHIIPQSIGGPNIYANKILAHTKCNHEKGGKIPYEYKFKGDIDNVNLMRIRKDGSLHIKQTDGSDFGSNSPLINLVKVLCQKHNKEQRGYKNSIGKFIKSNTNKRSALANKIDFLLCHPEDKEYIVGDFSNLHLNSTAWINKIIMDWSKDICPKVTPSFGALTAYLRNKWHYSEILPLVRIKEGKKLFDEDNKEIAADKWKELFISKDLKFSESKALIEDFNEYINSLPKEDKPVNDTDKQEEFEKFCQSLRQENKFNKRCDHRHHAVDAVIIGLSTLSLIQQASLHNASYGGLYGVKNDKGEIVIPAFEIKKEDAVLYRRIKERAEKYLTNFVVWHKPDHFPSGKFFDETAYYIKDVNGEKRLTIRQSLEKVLNKEKNVDKFIEKLQEVVVGEEIKNEIIKQIKERLKKGMSLDEAFLKNDIKFRWSKIRKLKVFYKERGFIQFDDSIDVNVGAKYYQNAGYACMDFDKNSGKVICAVPLWKFKPDCLLPDAIRVFINDIVYDKKSKEFYKIISFQFNKQKKQIICNPVSDSIKQEKSFNSIESIMLCGTRADIAKIKKEYGK